MDKLPEFFGNHPQLFLAAGVIFVLMIINEWRIRNRGFVSILPTQVVQLINQGAKVLDIRGETQYKQGHILNALHMPADKVSGVVDKLHDKNNALVVVCESGVRCHRVAKVLVNEGYSNVSILRGGIQAWISDKMPISK